jgi:hypothetical protein
VPSGLTVPAGACRPDCPDCALDAREAELAAEWAGKWRRSRMLARPALRGHPARLYSVAGGGVLASVPSKRNGHPLTPETRDRIAALLRGARAIGEAITRYG